MKKEKERENCPSQGGISSKINSCQGGRLKSVSELKGKVGEKLKNVDEGNIS